MSTPEPPPVEVDRSAVFTALTGRAGANPSHEGTIRGMLLAAYGQRPDGNPDTTEAARRLHLTPRTVRRWLANERAQKPAPKSTNVDRLRTSARRSESTKRGRTSALRRRRDQIQAAQAAPARPGAAAPAPPVKAISLTGVQGPHGAGQDDYKRNRTIRLTMTPDDTDAMYTAYEQGGHQGFTTWARGRADRYVDGWEFDNIDDLRVE